MRTILTPMHLGYHATGCEKICYSSRKIAKRAASLLHGDHLSAYRCSDNPNHFHIGHLAPAILEGRTTRKRLYQQDERADQGSI